jgi:hypothetical protein
MGLFHKRGDVYATNRVLMGAQNMEKSKIIQDSLIMAFMNGRVYKASLLKGLVSLFPKKNLWYEDAAGMPIILSFAETFAYAEGAMYYYRQHSGQITANHRDPRSLNLIESWAHAIRHANQEYLDEVVYATFQSSVRFWNWLPLWRKQLVEFQDSIKDNVFSNKYLTPAGISRVWIENCVDWLEGENRWLKEQEHDLLYKERKKNYRLWVELNEIKNSTSWRATKPLRELVGSMKNVRRRK